ESSTIYLIDFGLALLPGGRSKRANDPGTSSASPDQGDRHRARRPEAGRVGTAIYASLNAHKGRAPARRDDIESLAYVLAELALGSLPWTRRRALSSAQAWRRIGADKDAAVVADVCSGLPGPFALLLEHARDLRPADRPRYEWLAEGFVRLLRDMDSGSAIRPEIEWEDASAGDATATAKVRAAQDLWNSQDPDRVALAYTEDTIWRNRDEFLSGRAAVRAFLRRKWERELDYRLRKELFCFADDRVAVQFFYEYRNASGGDGSGWRRCYGLEHWTFDRESGLMRERRMSGNDVAIAEADRWFRDGDLHRQGRHVTSAIRPRAATAEHKEELHLDAGSVVASLTDALVLYDILCLQLFFVPKTWLRACGCSIFPFEETRDRSEAQCPFCQIARLSRQWQEQRQQQDSRSSSGPAVAPLTSMALADETVEAVANGSRAGDDDAARLRRIVYADDRLVAFHDINPSAPVHLLVVPHDHIGSVMNLTATHLPLEA
ncbi:hypothetical protein HK405_010999, partial [Cladochytrium tenue]